MSPLIKSFALDAYLKTATGGNVHAEHAFAADRWQLVCVRCKETLTFVSGLDIADDYTNKGKLDASVQEFAKKHCHLSPKYNPVSHTVNYEPKAYDGNGSYICSHTTASGDTTILEHALPTTGEIIKRCARCAEQWSTGITESQKKILKDIAKQQEEKKIAHEKIQLQQQMKEYQDKLRFLQARVKASESEPASVLPVPKTGRKFR